MKYALAFITGIAAGVVGSAYALVRVLEGPRV